MFSSSTLAPSLGFSYPSPSVSTFLSTLSSVPFTLVIFCGRGRGRNHQVKSAEETTGSMPSRGDASGRCRTHLPGLNGEIDLDVALVGELANICTMGKRR